MTHDSIKQSRDVFGKDLSGVVMDCPSCKTNLALRQYEKINIDQCPQCWGVWLDQGELQPILSARDIHFSPVSIEETIKDAHTRISKSDTDIQLMCPKCSRLMHSLNYSYSSGVIINTCPDGHGIWFDKDELAKVQIFMEHWDEAKHQNNEKWMNIQKKSREIESAKLSHADELDNSKTGPIGRTINAIFDMLSSLSKRE